MLVSLVRSVSLSLGPAMRSMLLNVLLFIGHARAGGHAIEGLRWIQLHLPVFPQWCASSLSDRAHLSIFYRELLIKKVMVHLH